jgi:branched-chain amino acid aminotransferase
MSMSTVERLSSGQPQGPVPNLGPRAVIIRPVQDQGVVWRNGQLVPFADATCHVLSHMAARGSQVFDVMLVTRTEKGPCAVGLRPHVARFLRSAELMGMEDVGEIGDLERAVAQTVTANASPVSQNAAYTGPFVVKLIAAWVEESVGILPADVRPSVYVVALPTGGDRIPTVLLPPAKVRSSSMPKIPASILPPSIKVAASYTPGVREQLRSRAEGYDHTIFRTTGGDLAESTTLSTLVVSDGRILAPPLDTVLDGITRRIVLEAAQDSGIPVEVRAISWDEVLGADELILSSTTHTVVPVCLLDDLALEAPGPVTTELAEVLTEVYSGEHRLSGQWLTPLTG